MDNWQSHFHKGFENICPGCGLRLQYINISKVMEVIDKLPSLINKPGTKCALKETINQECIEND